MQYPDCDSVKMFSDLPVGEKGDGQRFTALDSARFSTLPLRNS
jgi:hypothetical protein